MFALAGPEIGRPGGAFGFVKTLEIPDRDTAAVYQCRLSLSTKTITYLADLLRGHLKKIGSRWRKLPTGRIALIVLAVLRHDQRLADMAGGNGVAPSTVRRWVWELIELLAARAPRLDRALKKTAKNGGQVVLLDGSLIRTHRRTGTDNRKNYRPRSRAPPPSPDNELAPEPDPGRGRV